MVAGGQSIELRGAQARPLPATRSAQCRTAVGGGVSLETCRLPDLAEGLLGLDPDIALALEEVVPQDLLLGEKRGGAGGSPGAVCLWGRGGPSVTAKRLRGLECKGGQPASRMFVTTEPEVPGEHGVHPTPSLYRVCN